MYVTTTIPPTVPGLQFPGISAPEDANASTNKVETLDTTHWTQLQTADLDKNPHGDVLLCYNCPVVGWPVMRIGFVTAKGLVKLRMPMPEVGNETYTLGYLSDLGPVYWTALPEIPRELMRDMFRVLMGN